MRLWLKVHREVAGAWRSACYDMYRHVSRRRSVRLQMAETAEFGPRNHRGLHVARSPNRHRIAATTGVALLVAGGAAGTYLAVAGSLTALRAESSEPPIAAPARPAGTGTPGPALIRPPSTQPTQPRSQVRHSTPPQVLALPEVPAPVELPAQTTEPESTQTPLPASPSPSATAIPSPSVSSPSPTISASNRPKWGRHGDEDAAAGQTGEGR